jgi:hypothetical protein
MEKKSEIRCHLSWWVVTVNLTQSGKSFSGKKWPTSSQSVGMSVGNCLFGYYLIWMTQTIVWSMFPRFENTYTLRPTVSMDTFISLSLPVDVTGWSTFRIHVCKMTHCSLQFKPTNSSLPLSCFRSGYFITATEMKLKTVPDVKTQRYSNGHSVFWVKLYRY